MPRISDMPRPDPLTGLELVPALQGGGPDGNVGLPLLLTGAPFGGVVLALRAPMTADLSATADANPGAGTVRWNHGTPGLASVLYVSHEDAAAGDLAAILAALQAGGFIYLQGGADSEARGNLQKWQVVSIDAAAGYTKVGVVLQTASGAFTADGELELTIQQPLPSPGVDRNVVTPVESNAGSVVIDCSAGDYFTLALAEDITGWTFANVPPGCSVLMRITQDATARTVAWPSSFRWVGGVGGVLSSAAGAVDLLALSTFDWGATWAVTLAKEFAP